MKRKIFATLLPTIAIATIVPATVVPVVLTSKTNNSGKTDPKVDPIPDVPSQYVKTITFTSSGVDTEGNDVADIEIYGELTQKIKVGKTFMHIAIPTVSKSNAEFVRWEYKKSGTLVWSEIHPYTAIEDDMTIRPVFDITACDKVFALVNNKYEAIVTSTLYGEGNIEYEDSTVASESRETFNKEIKIGKKVTALDEGFLSGCVLFNSKIDLSAATNLTYIGDNFMYGCEAYNNDSNPLNLADTKIMHIGSDFLSSCIAFNQLLTLPTTLKEIGNSFMEDCQAFAQNLTIPASVNTIGSYFLFDCPKLDGQAITINCPISAFDPETENDKTLSRSDTDWTTGIYLLPEAKAVAFKAKYEDRTSAPYRKLVDATLHDNYCVDENNNAYVLDLASCCGSGDIKGTSITTNEEVTWSRAEFNCKIYFKNDGNLTSIGDDFLAGCKVFNQSFVLPASLTTIGTNFISSTTSFKQALNIPSGVTSIGTGFMLYSDHINVSLTVDGTNTTFGCESGVLYNKTTNTAIDAFSGFDGETWPSAVTAIGTDFLKAESSFASAITIPSTITSIGSGFLTDCSEYANTISFKSSPSDITITATILENVPETNTITFKVPTDTSAAWQEKLLVATGKSTWPTAWTITEE